MNADGPLFDAGVNLGHQLKNMASSGVGTVRVDFIWAMAQPYASWKQVPASSRSDFVTGPGGVPTDFQSTDQIVQQAARHRLALLPVVLFSPYWDGYPTGDHIQPAHDGPYGRYLTALVERYGPHGTFWTKNPSLPVDPITQWQIWNEPDLIRHFWNAPKFAPSYVRLLKVAHDAIKRADPSAKVVLASLPSGVGSTPGRVASTGWHDLGSIYKVKGSRHLFDEVASNPYTLHPSGVVTILQYFRKVMNHYGDSGKPMIATEVGWPSATGKTHQNYGFNTTERGQAKKLAQLLPLLAAGRHQLRLAAFYYYTWLSTDQRNSDSFNFAGLSRVNPATGTITPKPAYFSFRHTVRSLEG